MDEKSFHDLMYVECQKCHGVRTKYRCGECRDRGYVLSEFGNDLHNYITDIIYDIAETRQDDD